MPAQTMLTVGSRVEASALPQAMYMHACHVMMQADIGNMLSAHRQHCLVEWVQSMTGLHTRTP